MINSFGPAIFASLSNVPIVNLLIVWLAFNQSHRIMYERRVSQGLGKVFSLLLAVFAMIAIMMIRIELAGWRGLIYE